MSFAVASTNLVLELTIVIIVLLGWRFALAGVVGAAMMGTILAMMQMRCTTGEHAHEPWGEHGGPG